MKDYRWKDKDARMNIYIKDENEYMKGWGWVFGSQIKGDVRPKYKDRVSGLLSHSKQYITEFIYQLRFIS